MGLPQLKGGRPPVRCSRSWLPTATTAAVSRLPKRQPRHVPTCSTTCATTRPVRDSEHSAKTTDPSSRARLHRDLKETMAIFDKYKPTHVIHLAALVGGLFKNMKYKLTFLRDNCLINDNVMWAAKEHNVRSSVSLASAPRSSGIFLRSPTD